MGSPRRARGVALALTLALSLSVAASHTASGQPTDATSGGSLQWRSCNDGAQCARLAVPVDDTVIGSPTLDLALVRFRARKPSERIGSLLINPGGPGASGVDFVVSTASGLPAELLDRFDIVGFDPRGVGRSAPVNCTDNLDPLFALDWAPPTATARARLLAGVRAFVRQCEQRSGTMLKYLTTQRTARDLDRIRAALGDKKLSYVGYSYGTYLGAWYAEQFPTRVRSLVLDGAVDPALTGEQLQVQQAVGFERDLDLFLRFCAHRSDCAFHRGGHPGRAYDQLRARIQAHPIAVDSGQQRHTLNATRFDIAVTQMLYLGRASWGDLAAALDHADHGDGRDLLTSADYYTGRRDDGTYDHGEDAFLAISCADGPSVGDVSNLRLIEEEAAAAAPRLGRAIVNGSLPCTLWPVRAPAPRALRASGAPPIVVVGTEHDPATPLAWAKALASELASGVLVTAPGAQHGSFGVGNECVDRLVVRYLVDLAVPKRDTRC